MNCVCPLSGEEGVPSEQMVLATSICGEPWAPFDLARRNAFLDALTSGVRSHRMACRLLSLNRSTVTRWIGRGKHLDRTDREGEPYRAFYVALLAAEAARDSRADTLLHRAAPLDWRAGDALAKRQERHELHPFKKRMMKAEAEIAEANVTTANANARRAHALAELAERGIHPVSGLLVFPPSFLDQCHPDERVVVEAAMVRLGYRMASPSVVEAMAAAQSEDEIREKEEFSARWRARLGAEASRVA